MVLKKLRHLLESAHQAVKIPYEEFTKVRLIRLEDRVKAPRKSTETPSFSQTKVVDFFPPFESSI